MEAAVQFLLTNLPVPLLFIEVTNCESFFVSDLSSRRCGGSVNDKETFLFNHQYMMKVYDSTIATKSRDLIISLLQADKRSTNINADYFSIGITLIRVEENRT